MTTETDTDPSVTRSESSSVAASRHSPEVHLVLPVRTLGPEFWRFLSASAFFDFGFGLFFFLFNLYLATEHFDERSIGLFTSAFTIGSLAATGPAGFIARYHGLRPLISVCFFLAPVAGILRTFTLQPAGQWLASFLLGTAMCGWAICTPTALARATDEKNRSLGFSINFAVGIGSGVLAGLVGGSLPAKLTHFFALPNVASGMRVTLVLACLLVLPGSIPLSRPGFLAHADRAIPTTAAPPPAGRFLIHFLIAWGMWSAVGAAFAPFANLYLMRRLGIPLPRIGALFAASQFLQVVAVLSSPLWHRKFGTIRSIVLIQISAAFMLLLISATHSHRVSIVELVILNAVQYMAGPSIYALLMTRTRDANRGTASAAQSLTSSLAGAAAAALAGTVAFRYGYSLLFCLLGATAFAAAVLFLTLPNDYAQ